MSCKRRPWKCGYLREVLILGPTLDPFLWLDNYSCIVSTSFESLPFARSQASPALPWINTLSVTSLEALSGSTGSCIHLVTVDLKWFKMSIFMSPLTAICAIYLNKTIVSLSFFLTVSFLSSCFFFSDSGVGRCSKNNVTPKLKVRLSTMGF